MPKFGTRRKVVGKVRRDGVQAGRVKVPAFVLTSRALVQNQRVRRIDHNNRVRAVVLDLEHAGAQVDRRRGGVAVGVRHRQLQKRRIRQRQRRGVVVAAGVGMPDVERLREGHHAVAVNADREVGHSADLAENVVANLVQHNRGALRAVHAKRKQPGRHVRTGQNQRIDRAARTVGAEVRQQTKIVGKVRRDGVQAGRGKVPAFILTSRALVQNQRVRRIDHNSRVRAVVLDREHTRAQVERRSVGVAVGVRHRLHQSQKRRIRQRQRLGIVMVAGVVVPDVGNTREGHHARRRVDLDGEVGGRADRAGDQVAGLVEHDLRALANPVAVNRARVRRIQRKQTRSHVRTSQNQRIGHAASTVGAKGRHRRKIAREVRRRRHNAVATRSNRALVQYDRRRRRIDHDRIRRVVVDIDRKHAVNEIPIGVRHAIIDRDRRWQVVFIKPRRVNDRGALLHQVRASGRIGDRDGENWDSVLKDLQLRARYRIKTELQPRRHCRQIASAEQQHRAGAVRTKVMGKRPVRIDRRSGSSPVPPGIPPSASSSSCTTCAFAPMLGRPFGGGSSSSTSGSSTSCSGMVSK